MKMAKIGLLIEKQQLEQEWSYGFNVFGVYLEEILSHAGMAYTRLSSAEQLNKEQYDTVIVAACRESAETMEPLLSFAQAGGTVIAYGGIGQLAEALGCYLAPEASVGYATLPSSFADSRPLRYLKAQPWTIAQDNSGITSQGSLHHLSPEQAEFAPALLQIKAGKGWVDRWSVDIPYTIVALQQGDRPVLKDGVPAPDGSGAVNDGILKADDRCMMDWELDRAATETGQPYFAHPYADLWREVILGHLLRRVTEKGLTLPFIGYWPDGTDYIAMISHDSDQNQDIYAEATLEVLAECGINSTWCMIKPGYSAPIYDRVKEAGHELAFHYNALTAQDGEWGAQAFAEQLEWLKEAANLKEVVSNKNHYTRFEEWGELFEFCEENQIAADQTRGPSKKGNVGFLFGTCHPYFPVAWYTDRNRLYDVLEIGFLTQDLDHSLLADTSVIAPFLEQTMRVQGVAHFLFHQVHIQRSEQVAAALRKVVKEAKQRGFEFWTCQQINDWERARRKMKVTGLDENLKPTVEQALQGTVVWVPLAEDDPRAREAPVQFGIPCYKAVL
ncbi:polysaccharide deacetylase family protein [Paenibacillus senegalensis]|uniref:hypothetical protein n=1 Tax=Paenibacillus senegalensis TaxID=1465766 RepID=UPI000288B59B|nr:hypothetical protein [Paenibacillus senegalensis]